MSSTKGHSSRNHLKKFTNISILSIFENSLLVQWLGPFTSRALGFKSLVRELRSCKPHGKAKKFFSALAMKVEIV